MSIECGECERDLRGGHGPGCSRARGYPRSQSDRDRAGLELDVARLERLQILVQMLPADIDPEVRHLIDKDIARTRDSIRRLRIELA